MKKLEHNKGSIYYKIDGEGSPIIFLNGFGLTNEMWKEQIEYLKKNFLCISYDLRGFGKSSLPNTKYSHQEDLYALLKELKINKAHLIGLSFGGYVAIDFALTYPETVQSLTTISSTLSGYPRKIFYQLEIEKGPDIAKQNWLKHELFGSIRKKKKAFKKLEAIVKQYSAWHWNNPDPMIELTPPAVGRLKEIKVPTQIILGKEDLPYFHEVGEILNSGISNSKKHIVKNAGHIVNMEQPEIINKLIEDFINSI